MTDGQSIASATGPPSDQVKTPAQGKLVFVYELYNIV